MTRLLSSADVKEFALKQGAELAGIAAVAGFPESVPPRPPQAILPSAKAVVVFGIPLLLGALSSNNRVAIASLKAAYNELDRLSYQIGRFLEQGGFRAAPIPSFFPIEMSKETRGMVGDLSFKHAAVAAGLAVWGRPRLVLNSEWGPRVRYAAIVTDAPLAGDAPLQKDFCTGCELCVRACPVGALAVEGKVDTGKCLVQLQRYGLPGVLKFLGSVVTKSTEEQQQAFRDPLFWNLYQHAAMGIDAECAECVKACPVGR